MSDAREIDPLEATLLDLLAELKEDAFPLILGGGYGLYLWQRHVLEGGEPLLLQVVPPLRSTNDLDVFLRTELLADSNRLKPLRQALERLGFTVIPSAQNYQFARKFSLGGRQWDIKVDLLAREPDKQRFPGLKYDTRRIKPDPSVGIHAHTTPEAIAIEEDILPLSLTGYRTDGSAATGTINLPSTYAFLMMKLFALRDQWQQESKEFGRKHALDIYTLIALMTQPELERSHSLKERYRETPESIEAGRIIQNLFATVESGGSLRLREHPDFPAAGLSAFSTFLGTLADLFPAVGISEE